MTRSTRSTRSRAEAGLRSFRKLGVAYRPVELLPVDPVTGTFLCAQRREGDEMACRCGARWPVGESHP